VPPFSFFPRFPPLFFFPPEAAFDGSPFRCTSPLRLIGPSGYVFFFLRNGIDIFPPLFFPFFFLVTSERLPMSPLMFRVLGLVFFSSFDVIFSPYFFKPEGRLRVSSFYPRDLSHGFRDVFFGTLGCRTSCSFESFPSPLPARVLLPPVVFWSPSSAPHPPAPRPTSPLAPLPFFYLFPLPLFFFIPSISSILFFL